MSAEEAPKGPPKGITVHAAEPMRRPVTYRAAVAADYAASGFSYLGDSGPSLTEEEIAHRAKIRGDHWIAPELQIVPGDMRLYGLLAPGLETAFYPPYTGIEAFKSVALQKWLDRRKKEAS